MVLPQQPALRQDDRGSGRATIDRPSPACPAGSFRAIGDLAGYGLGMLALAYRNEFLHFMNRLTGFELFPASIYGFQELPALIIRKDILLICGSAWIVCILGGLIPAWRAGRLRPVEALRYE